MSNNAFNLKVYLFSSLIGVILVYIIIYIHIYILVSYNSYNYREFLSWGCGGSEKSRLYTCSAWVLCAFSADSTSELDILGHDGNPLGVDGTQVGVLEQTDQVGLAGFLKGHHSRALKA